MHVRPRRRTAAAVPPLPFLTLCAILCTLRSAQTFPISHAIEEHHPPDYWAQLLHADRFEFVKRPEWVTTGVVPDDHSQSRDARSFVSHEHVSSSHAMDDDLSIPVTSGRSFNYTGDGNLSKFIIHTVNEPPQLNLAPVMKKVLEIIEGAWQSEVVVLTKVFFTEFEDPNKLARGGGTYFIKMKDLFDTALPVAAAEAIRKRDLNADKTGDDRYDVLITINSKSPWFTGTVGKPLPTQYDLVTVLLHEIYHNVLFAGAIVAEVRRMAGAPGGYFQSARLYNGYRTRFDAFLANKDGCAVLGYLQENEMAKRLNVTTNQLLAHACSNNSLYFSYNVNTRVGRLYAPNLFKAQSSVYHLDYRSGDENSLMFPTITRGTTQHFVGRTIRNMAAATLNTNLVGANRRCRRPLVNPLPIVATRPEEKEEDEAPFDGDPVGAPRNIDEDDVRRIGGLPVWAFALIIVFSILLALLLLGICLALLLRKRKKKTSLFSSTSSSKYASIVPSRSRTGTGTSTHTSHTRSISDFIPSIGGGKTSSKRSGSYSHSRSRSESRHTSSKRGTSRHSSSKHTTSKHTTSKHTTTKHSSTKTSTTKRAEETSSEVSRSPTCPSSGKDKYICRCHCCCPEPTRPPPVASVHTFDPDSIPSVRAHSSHKKSCKPKEKSCHHGCHCCHCCRYKPSSSKSSSKCSKTTTTTNCVCKTVRCESSKCVSSSVKGSSTRAPPSTRPPPPSTKPPCVRSSSCKPSSCKPSSCKPSSCKPAASSCREPPSCKPSQPVKKKCCKSKCKKCTQVVEINLNC